MTDTVEGAIKLFFEEFDCEPRPGWYEPMRPRSGTYTGRLELNLGNPFVKRIVVKQNTDAIMALCGAILAAHQALTFDSEDKRFPGFPEFDDGRGDYAFTHPVEGRLLEVLGYALKRVNRIKDQLSFDDPQQHAESEPPGADLKHLVRRSHERRVCSAGAT
jgi:hypothetical protein